MVLRIRVDDNELLQRSLQRNVLLFTDGSSELDDSLHAADGTLNFGVKVFFSDGGEVEEVDRAIIDDVGVLWNESLEGLIHVLSQEWSEGGLKKKKITESTAD